MTAILAVVGMMLVPNLLQQPTVQLTQSPTGLRVTWTAPAGPRINHWIGILLASKPDNTLDIPGAWYKYLPLEGENGTMDFGTPAAGEYEARYFGGNSGPLVTRSPKITVGALPVDPVDPPPAPPVGTEPLLYFEITYVDGRVVEGPTSDTFENVLYRYRNSALFVGVSKLRVWKLQVARPLTPADIELTGTVRSEIP